MGLLNIIRRMKLREKQSIHEISRHADLPRNTLAKYSNAAAIESMSRNMGWMRGLCYKNGTYHTAWRAYNTSDKIALSDVFAIVTGLATNAKTLRVNMHFHAFR